MEAGSHCAVSALSFLCFVEVNVSPSNDKHIVGHKACNQRMDESPSCIIIEILAVMFQGTLLLYKMWI